MAAAKSNGPTRVLIVANRTAGSQELLAAVAGRAAADFCAFTLLVPASPQGLHRIVDPEDHGLGEAHSRLDTVLPALSAAAETEVMGIVGSPDPIAAVQDALNVLGFDEVIVSMLPARLSRWLHLDLPRKIRALGVPVHEVVAGESSSLPAA